MKKNSLYRKLLVLYRIAIYSGCILLILSFILFSIGCESVDGTDTASENGSSNSSETENTNSGEDILENGDSIDTEESGEEIEDSSEENGSSEEENQTQTEDGDILEGELTIKVYYGDEQGEYLIGESRKVSSENKYEEALYELMKLPVDSSLIHLVPETTIINSIEVENGLARVDLSNNFVEDRYIGDAADILLVYSVVNTLTEFSGVDSVTFYIDGKKLNTLGALDISGPVYRKNDLIKT